MNAPYNEQDLNQNKILELALYHPLIGHCVQQWKQGVLTWEQANYAIIFCLLDRNTELMKDLLDLREALPPSPIVFKVGDINPEMLRQIANLPRQTKR